MYLKFIKPFIDYVGAIFLLILISPLFIIISIILFFQNKGSVFYLQDRNGKHGRVFKVIKFKTMNDAVGVDGKLLPNSERLTPIGRLIRSTSLDEIPQLINILKGEMSFIGPRPLPVRYYPYFNEFERKRFYVLPGISGLAQVKGRNTLDWNQRLLLDVKYVDNVSLLLDLKIFISTIINIITRKNLIIDPTAKMIDFDTLRKNNSKIEFL